MAAPLVLPAAIMATGGIISGLLNHGDPEPSPLPDWYIRELFNALDESRTGGFQPDATRYIQPMNANLYNQDTNARVAGLLSQIPMGVENFNADLGNRGIYGAGEAPKNLYSSVYAPVAQGVAQVASQNALGYQTLEQNVMSDLRQNELGYQTLQQRAMNDQQQIRLQLLNLMRNPGQGNIGNPNPRKSGYGTFQIHRGFNTPTPNIEFGWGNRKIYGN